MLCFFILAALASTAPEQQNAPPIAVVVADHIGLHVANPEVSAEFYQRVLGLQPLPQTISPTMRWLHAGKFELHLIGGRTKPVEAATDTHFAFRVPSVAKQAQIFDRNHVPWTDSQGASRKVTTRADGVLQVYFVDPDGYQIEVNQAAKQERP